MSRYATQVQLSGPFFLHMANELPTIEIKGAEIFATGTWNSDVYNLSDLEAMVEAFGKVGFEPPVKAGHEEGQEQNDEIRRKLFGVPALGYVKRLYLSGKKLLADLGDVPARFGQLIKAGAYKRISAEIFWNYNDESTGKKWPRVLKAISFLGADIPALTNLKAVESLYKRIESGALVYKDGENEVRVYDKDYCGEMAMPAGLSLADYLIRYPRKPKDEAGYDLASEGDTDICGDCKYWIPGMDACTLVEGQIQRQYTCDYFEAYAPRTQTAMSRVNFDFKNYTIQKRGDKWCLISKSNGKTIGCHDSEEGALAQERAIQANKHTMMSPEEMKAKIEEMRDEMEEMEAGPEKERMKKKMADMKAKMDEMMAGKKKMSTIVVSRAMMREVCPPCAEKMEAGNISAIKLFSQDGGKTYEMPGGMSEEAMAGLCEKFSPAEGFRTRCMDSKAADKVDDVSAFCNALKSACAKNMSAKTEAKIASENGGPTMAEKEQKETVQVDEAKILAQVDEKIAVVRKDYEVKLEAKDQAIESGSKRIEELEKELAASKEEKRVEGVKAFLREQKVAGKIGDSEMSRAEAIMLALSDSKTVKYAQDGKEEEVTQLQAFKQFITKRPSLFKEISEDNTGENDDGKSIRYSDASEETEKRAKVYMEKNPKATLKEAYKVVWDADPKLFQAWQGSRQ